MALDSIAWVVAVAALAATLLWTWRSQRALRRTADALRASEAHFRSLVENALDVIAMLDRDGRVLYVSPSVRQALGCEPKDLEETVLLDRVVPEDRAETARVFADALQHPGATHGITCHLRHDDGEVRVFETRGSIVQTPGAPPRALMFLRDVTEARAAEARRRELESQLRMAQKGQAAPDSGDGEQLEPPGSAEPATPAAVAPEPLASDGGAAGRLLLVDDEPAVLVVCKDLLELSGFDVVSVGSGAEAEARFAADPGAFDVVVTDHNMPSMTGTELAERLTRLRADVPIVLTTGFSESEVAAGEGETAVTAVVTKPYAVEELLDAIARARSARG